RGVVRCPQLHLINRHLAAKRSLCSVHFSHFDSSRACMLIVVLSAVLFAVPVALAEAPLKKVLFFSKSSNFEHAVIKRVDGKPSWVEQILAEQGPRHGIDFVFSKDGSLFNAEYI